MVWTLSSLQAEPPEAQLEALRSLPGTMPREAVVRLFDRALETLGAPVQVEIVRAVAFFGADGIPLLIKALRQPERVVRREAAAVLGKLGKVAEPAVPVLGEALADSCVRVRLAAAVSLGNIGPQAAGAVGGLIRALCGSNLILGRLAAQAMSRIGLASVPSLVGALRSTDPYVRREAAWALGEIGEPLRDSNNTPLPPKVHSLLGKVREWLRGDRTHEQPTVRLLLDKRDTPPMVPLWTAEVRDVIPELTQLLSDPEAKVREAASVALSRILNVPLR